MDSIHKVLAIAALSLALPDGSFAQDLPQADVAANIARIRADDVAWRQIPWKTCLLDGLATAQRQDKPIMFWCHIDRPVDDTRC